MSQLLVDLKKPIDQDEWPVINDLLVKIVDNQKAFLESDFSDWQRRLAMVAESRVRSSNTLKRGDLILWQAANAYVQMQVQEKKLPTWESICEINAILNDKNPDQVIRTNEIFIGPHAAPPAADLEVNLDVFKNDILFIDKHPHPLVAAALIQYWIISLHPFVDANGRTAVLVADWIASYFGYLPQSFETILDGVIAHFANRQTKASPARAVYKVLTNILRSYQLFLG